MAKYKKSRMIAEYFDLPVAIDIISVMIGESADKNVIHFRLLLIWLVDAFMTEDSNNDAQ